MKNSEEDDREVLIEPYFGIGLGITVIDNTTLIILPFFVILITKEK